MRVEFSAGNDDADRRLETVLRRLCPNQSLGALHKALRQGDIRLNGAKAGPQARLSAGDTIAIWDKLLTSDEGRPTGPVPAPPIPSDWVLFENADLLVLNKPSGILVHRGEGSSAEAPLDDRVRARLAPSADPSLGFRPGPLHRLDRETSGIVVFSKTLLGARRFSEALADRQIAKTYLAVLAGRLSGPQEVRNRLQRQQPTRITVTDETGDEAVSSFRPLAWAEGLTLAEVDLGTGRTHQIRVHAQTLGFPLAGDSKYSGGRSPQGLDVPWVLHAWRLASSLLPALTAPLPPLRADWIKKTFKISV